MVRLTGARPDIYIYRMRFFRLIQSGVDVAPLLSEASARMELWAVNTSRQDRIAVQRDTNTIFIRSPVSRPDLAVNDNQESRFTGLAPLFPKAVALMSGLAKTMNAELSRATIVRLKPKGSVARHTDAGSYYLIRDRYHLVLYSGAGSILRSGDEEVRMRAGELWWFNNKQFHESYNESDEWRIHYIFDLLPITYKHLAVNPVKLYTDAGPA
jgi:hypothetical protein